MTKHGDEFRDGSTEKPFKRKKKRYFDHATGTFKEDKSIKTRDWEGITRSLVRTVTGGALETDKRTREKLKEAE